MTDLSQVPVPKDFVLPLPAPEGILVVVLVAFFLVHIVFVNLMVGSAWLSFYYEIKGLKNKAYDKLAYAITSTITVNKSLAVVMGVGPLLAINALYPVYFYSSTSLTGHYWIGLVPLIAGTFLLTYLHKYCWHKMDDLKPLHLLLSAIISLAFLFIPLIFLTNITLMLAPERWVQVQGFWSALMLPNVFARYGHFILGSLAFSGLMIAWLFGRKDADIASIGLSRGTLVKKGYKWALIATALQFVVGPAVLFTLPEVPHSIAATYGMIGAGVVAAVLGMLLLVAELRRDEQTVGKDIGKIVLLFIVTVLCMGSGRHMYRKMALKDHRAAVEEQTEKFAEESQKAREAAAAAEKKE